MKKLLSLLIALMASANLFAQEVEMADVLRTDGKIYVVVAVLGAMLAGLLFYVIRLDRKITRLEKDSDYK
jgi:uncharacterized integral membrane protein